MSGSCKFGSTCRYKHHGLYQEKSEIGQVHLNFSGLPFRPEAKECPYYMHTGSCKFSTNCRFHHPDPTFTGQDPFSGSENAGSPDQLASGVSQLPEMPQSLKTSNEPISSSIASQWAMLFPPKRLHSTSDWNNDQAPLSPSASNLSCPTSQSDGPIQRSSASNALTTWEGGLVHQQAQIDEYPHRPGERVCSFFMTHGICKFKSACKFHHPSHSTLRDLTMKADVRINLGLTEEYPERPGQPDCSYFIKHGTCQFGLECKSHHPSPSTWNGLTRKPSTSNGLTKKPDSPVHHQGQTEYPERPGEPECTYFMKFGSCKFRAECKYHHPTDRLPRVPSCIINPSGLPERHDQPICSYYSRFGICKFGPKCKFDHPMDYGSSVPTSDSRSGQGPFTDESEW